MYAVKHNGHHKARLVADGHLRDEPLDSVYSGVVSLRGIHFVAFIAELNSLKLWATDIGNAYLEATTKEKLLFCCSFQIRITNVCCPEFEAVELCNEGNKVDASEGHNTGVDTV